MEKEKYLQTPSQTVGPYFAYGLTPEQYHYNFNSVYDQNLVDEDHPEAIRIYGQVKDGNGIPIPDALIEILQSHGESKLIGRCGTGTDKDNRFFFTTLKPKAIDDQAPFITVIVFMRGQLIHSFTRIYFEDEQVLNNQDKVLNVIEEARRTTLIAKVIRDKVYQFDIHMQGDLETVFFAL